MDRRTVLGLLAVLPFAALGCKSPSTSSSGGGGDGLKELTVEDVSAKIAANDGKTFVYDNNSKERYAKGHLPGARWVDYENVTAADLPPNKDATLVFYCASEL